MSEYECWKKNTKKATKAFTSHLVGKRERGKIVRKKEKGKERKIKVRG